MWRWIARAGAAACIVLVIAWIASLKLMAESLTPGGYGAGLSQGHIMLHYAIWADRPLPSPVHQCLTLPAGTTLRFEGLRRGPGWSISIPIWCPLASTLVITALSWRMAARGRSTTPNCVKCGYDRTGLAGAAVCPECSAPPPAPTTR